MESLSKQLQAAVQQHQSGDLKAAEQSYRSILETHPEQPDALHLLGVVCHLTGRGDLAIDLIRRALAITPHFADGYHNLGKVYRDRQDHVEAEKHYRKVVELRPEYAEAHFNLGNALRDQRKFSQALQQYERTIKLEPNHSSAHFTRAITWLQLGDFEKGWPEYAWRWQRGQKKLPNFGKPAWDGSELNGKTILLYSEQGLGDTIQFMRYVPRVKNKGGKVIVAAPGVLIPLLSRCEGIDRWEKQGDPLPAFDFHASLMDLPGIFGDRLETIPRQVPYVFPDPQLVDKWRRAMSELQGFKIGIAWQGSPTNERDGVRSIALTHFEPLTRCANVRLLSLQKNAGAEQLKALRDRFSVTDLGSSLDEGTGAFMDTAAVMKSLDLVVTSDTAMAHLAGALGVPVWVGLPYVPDWRWLVDQDDSPWYPTMRLFRQTAWGDWESVFQRMADALPLKV